MVAVGVGGVFIFFVVMAMIMLAISDTEIAKDFGGILLFAFCVGTGGVGVIVAIIAFILYCWREDRRERKNPQPKGPPRKEKTLREMAEQENRLRAEGRYQMMAERERRLRAEGRIKTVGDNKIVLPKS